ncbi:hypothetical protein LIA77_01966 [Sarocladium implicatum]|nr:hypothetical protein LIA77_01966 [Sarocladium implicatum]
MKRGKEELPALACSFLGTLSYCNKCAPVVRDSRRRLAGSYGTSSSDSGAVLRSFREGPGIVKAGHHLALTVTMILNVWYVDSTHILPLDAILCFASCNTIR